MQIDGWKYYNHAAIPTTAPHDMKSRIFHRSQMVVSGKSGGGLRYWQGGLQNMIVATKQIGGM